MLLLSYKRHLQKHLISILGITLLAIRDKSRHLLTCTDKFHLDLEINLLFAVLQYWQEADGSTDKPMTTSNSMEYPVLRSSQEMLAIIKR